MRNLIAAPVLLLFLATVGACITYEAIPVTDIGTEIKPGNHVIITTYAGDELRFEVQEVDVADRLVIGKDARVPFDDVALIEHKRYGWGRAAAAVGGTTLVLVVALTVLLFLAFG